MVRNTYGIKESCCKRLLSMGVRSQINTRNVRCGAYRTERHPTSSIAYAVHHG